MKNNQFCHLHLHNEYSYLDGYGTAKKYTQRAKELEFSHIALTNHGNIDGLIQWQQECDKLEISPVLGVEMYIVPNMSDKQKGEKKGHIILLVKNSKGWKELCKIMTIANLNGFYYKPRIDFDFLLSCDLSGLIILTACAHSFLHLPKGEAFLWSLVEKKTDVYIEIMPHIGKEFDKHNERLIEYKEKYGLELVATNDCHYVRREDWETHEVLLAIQTKAKWKDETRWKFDVRDLYLRSANKMANAFKNQNVFKYDDYNRALKNTIKIADMCDGFRIEKKKMVLPVIYPNEVNEEKELWKWTMKGLFDKGLNISKYKRRLEYELKIIKEKNFIRYFLIVGQLIDWCQQNKIMTGAGRGSVGGSLTAYLMGITTVDPIKYKLLFSRFINKNRIDLPDIDLDFEDAKRGKVREYLEEKYGEESVFGVSTFLSMKGRAVVRDVSRVFDVPLKDVNEFTKSMEFNNETSDNVDQHVKMNGRWFAEKYPEVVRHAVKLEGQLRGVGQHAAGIVIIPKSVNFKKGSSRGCICIRNGASVINWETKDIDYVGLIKFDVLGLNTLTILKNVEKNIIKRIPDFRFRDLIPDDQKVFHSLSLGETTGIFQISTPLMTDACKKIEIGSFDDMVAALALVRPGAMHSGMLDEYIKRRHSKIWEQKHKDYEKITKETYGTLIYQEQVMQVIHKVAGLPYSIADEIRKVIAKKRSAEEFEPYRRMFMQGCKKVKIFKKTEAKEFWKNLLNCADYLFNKSHSVEYAMLAYWTAWAKYYYPVKFITACLNYGGEASKQAYIDEAVRLGLTIVPPKIAVSGLRRWKTRENKIYVPFIEIKGVGEKTVEQCRETNGFFKTEQKIIAKTKIQKILNEIKAYDINSNDVSPKYFKFVVSSNIDLQILKNSFTGYGKEEVLKCKACSLIKECFKPVIPSSGVYSVAIIGGAPGWNEDKERKSFVGQAGQLLFKTIEKFGGKREHFHVTNACKCFPSVSKTPNQEQIKICSEKWLKQELENIKCSLILCVGGSARLALTGEEGGITKMSGHIEYNKKYNCYVSYVIHPVAVLKDSACTKDFETGIKFFMDKFSEGLQKRTANFSVLERKGNYANSN